MCGTVEQTEIKRDRGELAARISCVAAAVIMFIAGSVGVHLIGRHAAEFIARSEVYSEYKEICCTVASVREAAGCTAGYVSPVSAGKTVYEFCRGTMIQYAVKYETDRTFDVLNRVIDGIKQKIRRNSCERLENVYMMEYAGKIAEEKTEHGGRGMQFGLLPQEPQR